MGKKHKRIKRETLISYLMIAPEMILMLIFIFIPIVYAFYISLFDWNAMGTKTFVGISNYLKMMQDLTFKSSLLVTGKYGTFSLWCRQKLFRMFQNIWKGHEL